jgi:hypothetical protein
MSIETLFLLLLIAFVIFSLPAWPYSNSWGYRPTGVLTVLLVVVRFFRHSLGSDIRSAGQDVGDSVRRTVNN